ncbi:MAG: hypothetical protein CO113_17570 [Elusimicrobia bacterium CG_4_9_14_3_um_filter_62_55]|nr:MAG: hypothetical protein COR54_11290 [Elusimicrobia bacterium CG22_combo_CG10-13_8_21_14_all_63_91]PJA17387.1 MAG: hypothetical protein COX66_04845 [Elusimicrobia bacterium CG_4_10_14_0_2_um_filter_63_34]PJB23608.1 MAG: hypothetical protein CO113_17570 [Elusimicrobia bacterium CG_4_9_14_3_um_filter_62_55]
MDDDFDCASLSDAQLIASLKACVEDERRQTVKILKRLNEVERRDLFSKKRYSSMFAFCIGELGYSEGAAARRIHAARAAKNFPLIYRRLSGGSISLTAVSLLAPHLDDENHRGLLDRCAGKSSREIDRILSEFSPRPAPRDSIRHLGTAPSPSEIPGDDASGALPFSGVSDSALTEPQPMSSGGEAGQKDDASSAPPGDPGPKEGERVSVTFSADQRFVDRLERARQLLRHKYPAARFEQVLADALEALLDRVDPFRREARRASKSRLASEQSSDGSQNPARAGVVSGESSGRTIPARLRDAVWIRDEGCCAYIDDEGRRCESRDFLEIDHVVPHALGGSSDDAGNLRLLCRAHNRREAARIFGEEFMRAASDRAARNRISG